MYTRNRPTYFVDPSGHDDRAANELARALAPTLVPINNLGNQAARPVNQRLEGVASAIVPGGVAYWKGEADNPSVTRQYQRQLLDIARNSQNPALTRLSAAGGAVLEQPGAVLDDIAHGLAEVPGQVLEAGLHGREALRAESWRGAAHETVTAIEKLAGAGETTLAAILLTRGGARIVEESRSASAAKTAPVAESGRMPTDMYDRAAWAEYWEANPEAARSLGAAGAKGARLRTIPEEPGVYHIEAAGEKYTGSGVDVRARLKSAEHPAADLLENPEAQITVYPLKSDLLSVIERRAIERCVSWNRT